MRSLFIHIPDLGESGTAPDPPEHRPLEKTPPRRRFLGGAAWTGRPFFNSARWWEFNGDVTPFFSDDFPHFSKKPPLCLGISTQIAMAQTATLPATRNWVNNWSCDWTHARRAICFRGFALWWLLRKHFALSNCTGSIGQQVHHVLEGFNLKGLCRSFEVSATGSATWKWQRKSAIINIILSIRVDKI